MCVLFLDARQMICFCGLNRQSDVDTQVLLKAVEKIVRIKLQMGDQVRGVTLLCCRDARKEVLLADPSFLACSTGSALLGNRDRHLWSSKRYL